MKKRFGIKARKDNIQGDFCGLSRVRVFGNLNSLDYQLYVDTGRGRVYNLFEKNKKF